jgi:diacylglycerol O-acyltransferase / wax synthase
MSNVLDLVDQVHFLGERATGTTNLLQCIWIYNRAIDIDGLQQFHHHLGRGRLFRRIEPSPLPFGRHRWVLANDESDLEIVATPRPRNELDTWLIEQAGKPLDAEHGPGWRLAVLPLIDGGSAVSLVVTHCLADGLGLCEALTDAVSGRDDPISWPAAGSRPRWRALREDARQTAHDARDMGRALVAAARLARRSRGGAEAGAPPPKKRPLPPAGPNERVTTVPMATIFVNADEWDARAHCLGGTSNALLAGFAAHLAQRVGRVTADGSVTLTMPVNERVPGDTRANAITSVDIVVDPAPVTTDLREIRAAIKQALIRHQDVPDERWALLPLAPLVPKPLARRMISVATGSETTVVSTNLGAVNPAVNRPDGTDADHFAMRGYPGMSSATIHRVGGVLAVSSARVHGQLFISVCAYQPGRSNSNEDLRQNISSALSDFSLRATTNWRTVSPV